MTKKTKTDTNKFFDKEIGNVIKNYRKMRGITQSELGGALGITFQQIQKYEKGTNKISATSLKKVSEFLKVPINEFFKNFNEITLLDNAEEFLVTKAFRKIKYKNKPRVAKLLVEIAKEF